MKKIKNYINGSYSGFSNKTLPIINPSTGEQSAEVILSNFEDFNNVIASSENAFNSWSSIIPLKRSRILSKFKENNGAYRLSMISIK